MTPTLTPLATEKRFSFGKNWTQFLRLLDNERILEAEKSLKIMLKVSDLNGLKFLDIGSGSGLFSLAARRLGASVLSFDYDIDSVNCTRHMKDTYFTNDFQWTVEQGSVLDQVYLDRLGKFDVVYSWGVLHHTGNLWKALDNAAQCVKPKGLLFIALYNDQGWRSRGWWLIKSWYGQGGIKKAAACVVGYSIQFFKTLVKCVVTRKNEFALYKQSRGMSIWHDYVDWIGGFPFEVATVKQIEDYFSTKGFRLVNLVSTRSWGCNQFVLAKDA